MKRMFRRLWAGEIGRVRHVWYWRLLLLIILVAVGYVLVEIAVTKSPDFGYADVAAIRAGSEAAPPGHVWLQQHIGTIWLWMAGACAAWRVTIIVASYLLAWRRFDRDDFLHQFVVHGLAAVIGIASAVGLLLLIGLLSLAFGGDFGAGVTSLDTGALALEDWLDTHIPTLFSINSYPVAILLIYVMTSFPGWVIHWLSHRSRFLWYTLHRPHHAAEILHPLGNAPAFLFEFFLAFPRVIIAAALLKLCYHTPLVMEASLIFLLFYFVEIFSHSSVHYRFAYRNPIVRNLCRLVGDAGVYHYLHHSSAQDAQMVNLGGGPFNLWDRLFGTYRKPPPDPPPIGLTGQPPLHMNPLRVIFSGFVHIAYELRYNRSWKTRFQIVFGGVEFQPPVSKEFLIRYPESESQTDKGSKGGVVRQKGPHSDG
ncbi:MAG: sterol desaturase family protein [Bacteroidota bacterium]